MHTNELQPKGITGPKVYAIVFKHKLFGDYETRFVLAYSDQEALNISVNTVDMINFEIITWGVVTFETIVQQLESTLPKQQAPQAPPSVAPLQLPPPRIPIAKRLDIPSKEKVLDTPEENLKNKIMNEIVDKKDKKLLESMKSTLEPWEYAYLKERISPAKKQIKKKSKK